MVRILDRWALQEGADLELVLGGGLPRPCFIVFFMCEVS